MIETRPIASIKVGDRARRDLGDIESLAASIRANGALLQPIVIRPDGTLIAGARRYAACKLLGRSQIEVCVRADLVSAVARLVAERDENVCRLDMTPSEKVELGRRLEELERPKAKERQGARTDLKHSGPGSGMLAAGEARDKVGEGIEMSGRSYHRAKTVVMAAEKGDPIAIEAQKEMDQTGQIRPAYRKVVAEQANSKNGKARPQYSLGSTKGRQVAESHKLRVETVVGTCQAFDHALHELRVELAAGVSSPEERRGWIKCLKAGESSLKQLRLRLERTHL